MCNYNSIQKDFFLILKYEWQKLEPGKTHNGQKCCILHLPKWENNKHFLKGLLCKKEKYIEIESWKSLEK